MAFLTRIVNAVTDFGTMCHQPNSSDVAKLTTAHDHFWNNRPNAGMRVFHTLSKETADLVYLEAARTKQAQSNKGERVFANLNPVQKAILLKRVMPVEISWSDWKEGWAEWKVQLRECGQAFANVNHESSADADVPCDAAPSGCSDGSSAPSCSSSDCDPAGLI